jgi:hypothetical protein
VSAPYSALFPCELGLISPVISCSWADIFCVPMMQCLRSDREIRAWGHRQAFAKHKDSHICFSATSELCCWQCRHKNPSGYKAVKNFLFISSFPFLPRLFCIKNKHSSRINLGMLYYTEIVGCSVPHIAKP